MNLRDKFDVLEMNQSFDLVAKSYKGSCFKVDNRTETSTYELHLLKRNSEEIEMLIGYIESLIDLKEEKIKFDKDEEEFSLEKQENFNNLIKNFLNKEVDGVVGINHKEDGVYIYNAKDLLIIVSKNINTSKGNPFEELIEGCNYESCIKVIFELRNMIVNFLYKDR